MDSRQLEAFRYAVMAHRGQTRSGSEGAPYVVHPIDVARYLVDCGFYETFMVQAALLHDVLEDTPTTADELRERFGRETEAVVSALTLPEEARGNHERKLEAQVEAMRDTGALGDYVRAAKMADKTSNIRSIIDTPPKWSHETMLRYLDSASVVVCEARAHAHDDRVEVLYRRHWVPTYVEAGQLLEKTSD